MKHLLSVADLDKAALSDVLVLSRRFKEELRMKQGNKHLLQGKTLVMIFEKPSLRTRLSFDIGMSQLGGTAIYLSGREIGIGERESVADTARVISQMGDFIMARVFEHSLLSDLAAHATIPVINGLSNWEHPCQALADVLTIMEHKRKLKGLTVAYVGDAENNILHSLILVSAILGMSVRVASPPGFMMDRQVFAHAKVLAKKSGATIHETINPEEAVDGADVVYTDTWVSMGEEAEKEKRRKVLRPYQVNADLMTLAHSDALFMHDMPAYRGYEVTSEVIDGPQSVIFEQAANRLHVQKGLLAYLNRA